MDERPIPRPLGTVEPNHMSAALAPAVRCTDCRFAWNSEAMAEGLRLLGSCPRCGGALEFADGAGAESIRVLDAAAEQAAAADVPPHLAMGTPRR
jgi:hypothetical protein